MERSKSSKWLIVNHSKIGHGPNSLMHTQRPTRYAPKRLSACSSMPQMLGIRSGEHSCSQKLLPKPKNYPISVKVLPVAESTPQTRKTQNSSSQSIAEEKYQLQRKNKLNKDLKNRKLDPSPIKESTMQLQNNSHGHCNEIKQELQREQNQQLKVRPNIRMLLLNKDSPKQGFYEGMPYKVTQILEEGGITKNTLRVKIQRPQQEKSPNKEPVKELMSEVPALVRGGVSQLVEQEQSFSEFHIPTQSVSPDEFLRRVQEQNDKDEKTEDEWKGSMHQSKARQHQESSNDDEEVYKVKEGRR